jgi:conjugal transfer pilus assembly protein TraA
MNRLWLFLRLHQATLRLAARVCVLVAALVLIRAAIAHAGNDITFDDLNTLVEGWTKGSLGKALALIALILGIGVAAARQSFGALFGGVGVAAAATIGPGVIDQVITALF